MNEDPSTTPHTAYLAGPMRGKPLYNFQLFAVAAMEMRSRGIFIYSPAERDLASGFQPHLPLDHPDQKFDLHEAFDWDFRAIQEADAVILLPGWEDSDGTKREIILAQTLGKDIFQYYYNNRLKLVIPKLIVSVAT